MKCPNCGHEQADGAEECVCCQVIFAKLQKRQQAQPRQHPAGKPEQPPFFHGLACMLWSSNRLYRVYILPGELVFIWAATGTDTDRAMGSQFGLLGALVTAATTTDTDQNAQRQDVLDHSKIEDLIADNEHNFRASQADFLEASLEPRSLWLAFAYAQPTHKGVFRFHHREKGKFALCLQTEEDVRTASTHLPSALGGNLRVDIR